MKIHTMNLQVTGRQETHLFAVADADSGESFFAGSDQAVIGTLVCGHVGRESAGLRQMFIHPACRRKGIGRALVAKAEELALLSGCRSMGLSLDPPDREMAGPFYRALGYMLGYEYGDGSLVLCKPLLDMSGAEMIRMERVRQREKYPDAHDDAHPNGELVFNAIGCLRMAVGVSSQSLYDEWGLAAKHQGDPDRLLVIAGALIAAEYDRRKRKEIADTDLPL